MSFEEIVYGQMTLMAKVQVTVTSSTKQAYYCNAWGLDPQTLFT